LLGRLKQMQHAAGFKQGGWIYIIKSKTAWDFKTTKDIL